MVLLALCDNANDQGECYPSISMLSRKCSMGERTVQNHITDMESLGIVRRESRNGRSNIYHIDPRNFRTPAESAPPQPLHPPPAESAPPPPQPLHPTPATVAPITISKPSIEPSKKQKKGVQAAPDDFVPLDVLAVLGVTEQTAKDWLHHRKLKKSAITQTVVEGIVREAGLAGLSVDAALKFSMESNWVGFRADWFLSQRQGIAAAAAPRAGAFNPTAHVNRNRAGGPT